MFEAGLLDPQERLIWERHSAGDHARAMALLLDAHGAQIMRFIRWRVRDPALVEEAYSEFTYDAWRGVAGFRWDCSVRAWAYTLARHALIRCSEKASKRRRRELPLSAAGELANRAHKSRTATFDTPQSILEQRIAKLCELLPAEDQTLVCLRVSRQLDWKEIALVMSEREINERCLASEAARLRKRFQLIKTRLRALATLHGS